MNSIDLELEEGKTYTFIGPSGCGKSTLLRMLIGLIKPDDGRLYFDERPYDEIDIPAMRAEFGYVIQTGGLFPHLTAKQNVALPAVYRKWPREKIETRVADLRELTQLSEDSLERYPGSAIRWTTSAG